MAVKPHHNNTHIVNVKDVSIDTDYSAWLDEIKQRYHSAQIKAAVKVNTEKLCFNWSVGRDLVIRKAEENGVTELSSSSVLIYNMRSHTTKVSAPETSGA